MTLYQFVGERFSAVRPFSSSLHEVYDEPDFLPHENLNAFPQVLTSVISLPECLKQFPLAFRVLDVTSAWRLGHHTAQETRDGLLVVF